MARIITVTSGKGGVGKTSISLNLSLALAEEGYRVCLFDADLGLANVSILTGVYPEKDLASVINGQFALKEIMIRDFMGIDIIPGSNGVEKMADLTRTQTGTLISAFLELDNYDFFIFDTSAGISAQVLSFCMASHEIILVATCEPTSLTDAYSMLKALSKYKYRNPVRVVINQVTSGKAAKKAYHRLKQTTGRFLSIPIQPLGIMAADKNVKAAVISQTPFYKLFSDTIATRCIKAMKDKLLGQRTPDIPLELFWDKALRFLDIYLKPGKESQKEERPSKETSPPDQIHPELLRQLGVLESKITTLANDVAVIKQMMKKQQENWVVPAAVSSDDPEQSTRKPESFPKNNHKTVLLDFEAWYKKQL